MTVKELVDKIYDDHYVHFDFMDVMGGECDCHIHTTLDTIQKYLEV